MSRLTHDPQRDSKAQRWQDRKDQMSQLDIFTIFHNENTSVYEAFKKFTFRAIEKGFNHCSADFIFHIIRWETAITDQQQEGFKVNNNFTSLYARMFMDEFPQHKDFFRIRKSKYDKT